MSMENIAVVRRLYEEVWNGRRFEVVNEIISPSHALQSTNTEGSAIGPEAYKGTLNRFLTALAKPTMPAKGEGGRGSSL